MLGKDLGMCRIEYASLMVELQQDGFEAVTRCRTPQQVSSPLHAGQIHMLIQNNKVRSLLCIIVIQLVYFVAQLFCNTHNDHIFTNLQTHTWQIIISVLN